MIPALAPPPLSPRTTRRRRLTLLASAALLLCLGTLLSLSHTREPALDNIQVLEDLVYRPENPQTCRLDLYRPSGPPPPNGWPLVVAIHGGGWTGGSFHAYGRSLARLAHHQLAVASVGYHLARNHNPAWPQNRDDVRASVHWLRAHAHQLHLNPQRIAALGASAGGHLATLLGTDPGPPHNGLSAHVSAVIDFYGPTHLPSLARVPRAQPALRNLLGNPLLDNRHLADADAASPSLLVSSHAPPMLLIHGALDPTVPIAQSRKLAQSLQNHGVPHRLIEVPNAAHGFGLATPHHDFLPEILEFLAQSWDDNPR